MDKFERKGDRAHPTVILDPEKKLFEISGRSMPEDVISTYDPVKEWIETYLKEQGSIILNLEFEYFNTATSKCLLDIMQVLEDTNSTINWYYTEDDEDMEEAGDDYKDILDGEIKFELIAVKDE